MEFSEACSEVDYILDNLNPEDRKKLPQTLLEFFKENKAIFYKVNLDTSKPLADQKLKDETKAFLQIINYKYFSNKEQKEQFKEIFKEDEDITDMFSKDTVVQDFNEEKFSSEENKELTVYKENKLLIFIKKILNIFNPYRKEK